MSEKLLPRILAMIGLFLIASAARSQVQPKQISPCKLAKHPKSFDGKTVRVRGTLNVYFEDFSLALTGCDTQQAIWLAFGGDVPGIVASTVNDTVRKPGTNVKVNGIPYGIRKDENFRKLYALIAVRHGNKPAYRVTATLTGAFFAGREGKLPTGRIFFSGYGHLGCCSLLLITGVSNVISVPPANLHVRGTVTGPDGKPVNRLAVLDDILGGSPPYRQRTATNKEGEFSFSVSGQLLRIENPEYRPLALPIEPGRTPVRLRLQQANQTDWVIPPCGKGAASSGRVGFSVLFALPPKMEASPFNDGSSSAYFIYPRGGNSDDAEFFISTDTLQGNNVDGSYFVDSKWSTERWIKDSSGAVVGVDAWGQIRHGGPWRMVVFREKEIAGYRLHPGEQSTPLDRSIDSACLANVAVQPRRH